jgi:AcrR family transcriptional regulator
MSRKLGSNEESSQRSHAALLRAGADLLVESQLRNPFAFLRVRGICDRAGYSPGAFYRHWKTLDAYYKDLAELLAATDAFDAGLAELKDAVKRSAEADALSAIAEVADLDLQLLVDNPLYDAMELINVTWARTVLREQMAAGYQAFDSDTGMVYGAILAARGREPCPPLDWDGIGKLLQSLLEGFTLRHKVDPTAVPLSSKSELSPYATAVAAVLAVVTRPAGDNASVVERLQALLNQQDGPPAPADGTALPGPRRELDHPGGVA